MAELELKIFPNPCLRVKARPVVDFNADTLYVLQEMKKMMYLNQGIGLAAPQVGLSLSVILIDAGEGFISLINPAVMEVSRKKTVLEEGCLSLPGLSVKVARPVSIKVRAQNENGQFFVKKFNELEAKVVQHEMDHLNGRLIIDYLNPVKRILAKKTLSSTSNVRKKRTCEVVCDSGKRYNK